MKLPIKALDIELSCPISDIEGLSGYAVMKGLVRFHGEPLGFIRVPVIGSYTPAEAIRNAILRRFDWEIIQHLLRDSLITHQLGRLDPDQLVHIPHPLDDGPKPLVTVAVCTRDRTEDLAQCLEALTKLDYPNLEFLVIDNSPSSPATERLVQESFPWMRYIRESQLGLDWARNRAIQEAKGEIIAYTDDDVIVDPGWVTALAKIFVENPEVMTVTGLVVAYELETEAQALFEEYGGFGRGFKRRWYRVNPDGKTHFEYRGAGQFGTGANMAYRKKVFDLVGTFDPALDVGTVTNGGGDLEMFFRVLKEGNSLVYEPSAIVRHRHRRDYSQLRTQIANNGVGLYSFFVRSAWAYREERWSFIRLGFWWLWYWLFRRLLISFIYPDGFPRDIILAELSGAFLGLTRYPIAFHRARELARQISMVFPSAPVRPKQEPSPIHRSGSAISMRKVELSQPIEDLANAENDYFTRVIPVWEGLPIGQVDIPNLYASVSVERLCEALVDTLGRRLLDPVGRGIAAEIEQEWIRAIKSKLVRVDEKNLTKKGQGLPDELLVSIVVGTCDRPVDLEACLRSLLDQQTRRPLEIIVVDNHPESKQTAPVVARFPNVRLVNEKRRGAAYARNAGILASTGEIIVTTDDDIVAPPDWIERLLLPFSRNDVEAVTGNVFAYELETVSQQLFEAYGGLSRGYEQFIADREWFDRFKLRAVPTWQLGGTANSAFRAHIFRDKRIGLMDEALGPGTPTGVGEDTYIFYKILKAGYTIVYEPSAYIWHKHRRTLRAFFKQIYNYSKGHVAYHLTTLFCDHDFRAIWQLFIRLPLTHVWRIYRRLRRVSSYTLAMIAVEIAGNLVGPFSLLHSYLLVLRHGRSSSNWLTSQRSSARSETLPVEFHHEKT